LKENRLIVAAFVYPVVAAFWIFIIWAIWSIVKSLKSIARDLEQIVREKQRQRPTS